MEVTMTRTVNYEVVVNTEILQTFNYLREARSFVAKVLKNPSEYLGPRGISSDNFSLQIMNVTVTSKVVSTYSSTNINELPCEAAELVKNLTAF